MRSRSPILCCSLYATAAALAFVAQALGMQSVSFIGGSQRLALPALSRRAGRV